MAELVAGAFLSSFFNIILASLASRDFGSHKGLMKKLEITLNSINQVLDEAEQKQYLSVSVKKWLDDLKHNIYEVDQLLDEIATPARRKGKARSFSVFANNQFESRIRELLKELAFLEMRMHVLELKEGKYANDEDGVRWRPLTCLPTSSDKEKIIKFLFSDNNIGSQVPILTIIGLGRMGKTTLAQLSYNDHQNVWHLRDGDHNIINLALRLSYHNLPSNLKRCFAYCSIFPKGYEFDKDQLINCWMAEGLLKCRGTHKSEEESGNEFFDDLESISFFQQQVDGQRRKFFLMPDLVNDLAKSVAGEFCLGIEGDRVTDIPKRTRHIQYLLELKDGDKIFEHIYKIKGLRSLMVQQARYFQMSKNVQRDLYQRLRCLRMLSFRGCYLSKLGDEIGNLKLLRYLDLSSTDITSLPNSICKLYNLQTLLLQDCGLTEFPADFHLLVNIRHLDLRRTPIKTMPKHMDRLHHLQMLSDFVVGKLNGSDIKKLTELNYLHGTLHISGLDNVSDSADAAKANLKDKKHLDGLYMMYHELKCSGNIVTDRIRQWDVLEALQPSINLRRLTIDDYNGTHFPDWLEINHLPNLVSLNLKGCIFCSQLPPLGQLPFLKELSVSHCGGIEIIGEEFYGNNNNSSNVPFKSLEIVRFEHMFEWKEWLCLEGFPCLKELSITYCPKLKGILPQHLPSLQKLVISNCRELEVSIPKADTIRILELKICKRILINDLPSSLKKAILFGNRYTESSLDQILFNSSFLEELDVHEFYGPNKEWLTFNWCSSDSLRTLTIKGWSSSSFPFAPHFTNLDVLYLENCSNLKSFPGGGLPSSLSILRIRNCPKLIASRKEWGLFKLNSLIEFDVSDDFENVKSFPEEDLLPPNLKSLRFYKCSKLRTINNKGLLHLKSLNSLFIGKCHLLERLPREGLLNSLTTLEIFRCFLLEHRYQKDKGEQWHTISRIPTVKFTNESDYERDIFFGDD